jgi:hypothetical protein
MMNPLFVIDSTVESWQVVWCNWLRRWRDWFDYSLEGGRYGHV